MVNESVSLFIPKKNITSLIPSSLADILWRQCNIKRTSKKRTDKTDNANTLVISTHGFIKKQSRVPNNEISKAEIQRKKYFQDKLIK